MSLLCAVQPTFCMEGVPAPEALWPDDGQEWTPIEKWDDVESFAGKLVAFRTTRNICSAPYKIGAADPTYYGVVQDRPIEFRERYGARNKGYCVDICQGWRARTSSEFSLFSGSIPQYSTVMRLVTFCEMSHIFDAIKSYKICCVNWGASRLPVPGVENTYFKLDNLTEKERRPYFRSQVHKTFWAKHRLLWLGRSESGSAFYGVPKDIIRLLARQVFQAEVDEAQQKSKLNDRLFLE